MHQSTRRNSDPDPLAGTRYRTVRRLRASRRGDVIEAQHRALGRMVVIKLVPARLSGRRDLADRVRREAEALGGLVHPNIVSVIDSGTQGDGRPYLVMERLVGRTMKEELAARGKLPPKEAVVLMMQALDALGAVHAAGLIHRDVTLENWFLCDAGRGQPPTVKLLDFGLAKRVAKREIGSNANGEDATVGDLSVGTPRFFSPEQALGLPLDARADLYAAGLVLYTLVAGRGPFDHIRALSQVLAAHVGVRPESPKAGGAIDVSPELEAVILRALAKRPEDRYLTASVFALALRKTPEGHRDTWGGGLRSVIARGSTAMQGTQQSGLSMVSLIALCAVASAVVVILARIVLR